MSIYCYITETHHPYFSVHEIIITYPGLKYNVIRTLLLIMTLNCNISLNQKYVGVMQSNTQY